MAATTQTSYAGGLMKDGECTYGGRAVEQFSLLINTYNKLKQDAYELIQKQGGGTSSIAVAPRFDLKTCIGKKNIDVPKPWAGIYVLDVIKAKEEVILYPVILKRDGDLPGGNYYRLETDSSFDERLYSHEKEWGFPIIYFELILQQMERGYYIPFPDLKKGIGFVLPIEELLQQ